MRCTHRRDKGNVGMRQIAGRVQRIASRKIRARRSDIGFRVVVLAYCDHVTIAVGVFLDQHVVGTVGQGCPGEDAHGLGFINLDLVAAACRNLANDCELGAGLQSRGFDGVAVHGGGPKGRLIASCLDGFAQDTPARIFEADGLGADG